MLKQRDVDASNKASQKHAELIRAAAQQAVATASDVFRNQVKPRAKSGANFVATNAPVVRDQVVLGAKCVGAYVGGFFRAIAGK